MQKPLKFSQRSHDIAPFHVMDILAQAKQLEAQGQDIIHLEVGEPDFTTPPQIVEAGMDALRQGDTHYTPALGLPALREAIAQFYLSQYGVSISSERIVVTPGASGALLLLMGAVVESDHQVLLTDPGYPCNRHFAQFLGAQATVIPVSAEQHYQLTASDIEQYWDDRTDLALVASPSNPTGTVMTREALTSLSDAVKARSGVLAVDEIYHGLIYDDVDTTTAVAVDDDIFVINSFSKFFGMTGWRLGWMVVPEHTVSVMDKLAQNLFLAPPTLSQYAALAAFEPSTMALLAERRQLFKQRRDVLLKAMTELGLTVHVQPEGAFYIYADCQHFLNESVPDSMSLARYWLTEAGVAVTPGNDFGHYQSDHTVRFSYTRDESRLLEAIARIAALYK